MSSLSADVARDLQSLPAVMRLVDTLFTITAANPKVRMPVELAVPSTADGRPTTAD